MAIEPALSGEFASTFDPANSVVPGSFNAFSVSFEPSDAGDVSSTFVIQTDGINTQCPPPAVSDSEVTIVLAGTGVALP